MLNDAQKRAAQAIVNVFETGKARGDYGSAVILPDGAGISYGRSQATDRADTLDLIVTRYVDQRGVHAAQLEPFLDDLQANATTTVDPDHPPAWARELLRALREAGGDPLMHVIQDQVFDANYWSPAVSHAESAGLVLPLSYAVVYDTCIQSGPGRVPAMRRLFPELPPARGGDEKAWTRAYVAARRAWLASFVSPRSGPEGERATRIVRGTVYRMEAFRLLMDAGSWELTTPFTVRGVRIE